MYVRYPCFGISLGFPGTQRIHHSYASGWPFELVVSNRVGFDIVPARFHIHRVAEFSYRPPSSRDLGVRG